MSDSNTIVFSHSRDQGYSQVDLSSVVSDRETAVWLGSYINSITAFASNPKYLSAVSGVNSFFTKDSYMVFLASSVKKDNRLYLENSVTVNTVNTVKDYLTHIENNEYIKNIAQLGLFGDDYNELKKALLIAALSNRTTVYCISDNDDMLNGVRKMFFSLPPSIVCRSSCIEVVGGAVPDLKASLVLCKCVESDDCYSYSNRAKSMSNYILVDCMGGKIKISANISQTTYAQRVVKHLFDFDKFNIDVVCRTIHSSIRSVKGIKLFDYGIDKDTYFNTVAYFTLANNYPEYLSYVYATAEEKENIEKYVSSRGILK